MSDLKFNYNSADKPWAYLSLGNLTKKYRVLNTNIHNSNLLSLSYGKIVQKDIESKKGLLPSSFDTYQVIKKDIIVFRVTDLQNDKKSLRVGLSTQEGIISPAYVCMECDTAKINPKFLYLVLHYHDIVTKVYYHMGDGLRQTLTYDDLKSLMIPVPSFEEQTEIVSYFTTTENLIQTSSNKVESLKQLKAASMISMFPQKGETKPRIRFKGFDGDWIEESAGNLFKTFDERNHPELPVLSACQDIRGMAPRSISGYDICHDKANEITYKRVKPGQFVIHLRSFQGGFAHSAVDGITSPAYTVFGFKDNTLHYDYFWKYVFMTRHFIDRLRLITYGIRDGRSISFNEFSELPMLYPSKEEQSKIATFFASLDKQIALETQRLEKLKQIKSACLDKMFV
jgi:type I restriction enzyme S subunit